MPAPSIDVHAHALPQSYVDGMKALGVNPAQEDGFPTPPWSEEAQLAFMDNTNQEFAVLSLSTPHIHRGDDELAIQIARSINDDFSAICHRHPDRLGFATTLPLPAVQASIEEARRGYEELGAIGVKVPSNANGVYLGDPSFEPLFEYLNEVGAVVTIHPSLAKQAPQGIFTAGPAPLFEYIVDTTRAVLNLMANGVIERYPNVKIIVPHSGSFIPPIAHRLIGISQVLIPKGMMEPIDVMGNLKSLYWDLAGDATPVMLEGLVKIADPSHLLYGADFPYTPEPMVLNKKASLEVDPFVQEHLDEIFRENARRLYGLA